MKEDDHDFDFPENYHTSIELITEIEKICNLHPDLISSHKLGISTEKKDILGYIISSDQKELESKPASLIIGCHHGREAITSEAAIYSIKHLLENYAGEIKNWIDESIIIYVPMLNPDGHDIVIRKNANEVDLNRNYTFNWGMVPGCSHDPVSQIYCGPAKLSEIEPQLINQMKIIEDLFKKFKNIKSSLDMHSGANVVMYPWGYTWDPAPDDALFKKLCQEMDQRARKMKVMPFPSQPAMEMYPTSGTYCDHAYRFYNCITMIVEIYKGRWAGNIWEFFNPPSDQVNSVCHGVLPVIFTMINYASKST